MPNVTLPPVVFTPDARDDETGSHYIGPFVVGSNLYAVLGTSSFTFLSVWKSTDSGQTWNRLDQNHAPRMDTNSEFDAILVGTILNILLPTISQDGVNIKLEVITFDTGTDTYGAYIGPGTQNATMPRLARFSNGDLLAAYFDTSLPGPALAIFSGGIWGAPVSFAANVSLTGLIMGPDDIARLFYFTHPAGVTVSMRTFTQGGVLSGQSAVFSSTYRANQEVTYKAFPVGRGVVWNGSLILPYYGNPTGSGFQAGVYVGTPYTAPVWTFTLVDTLVWAGTELDSYAYAFVDSHNNLILFWCAVDTVNNISRIYFAINSGAGFAAPVLFYDLTANPPVGAQFGPVVRTLSATLFTNGKYGVISSSTTNCAGFYLIDGTIAPPPVPAPPTPIDYWNPGTAETLLCEKQYPWIVPPKDAKPVRLANSIPAPVANVLTELWNYQVPDGFWFVFDRLAFLATVAGYVDGSGSLFFILDVNSPIGNPLPVARPIAKFTRQVGELSEPQQIGPVQLYQGDTLRAKVLSVDATLGVGLPNVIHAIAEGWLFPHSRNI